MAERLLLQLDRDASATHLAPEVWAALTASGGAVIGAGEPVLESDVRFVLRIARNAGLATLPRPGLLACAVDVPWADGWLLRVDRITLAAGSITPRHRHQGPGIRLMASGAVDAMVGETRFVVQAGEAWLERPEDDVIGRADPLLGAVFHRFVILPPNLAGGASSFVAREREAGDPTDAPFEREQVILAERVVRPAPPPATR